MDKIQNIKKNLLIQQVNNSDAIAYNRWFLETPVESNFNILKAFEGTEKEYARLELAIKDGTCEEKGCQMEMDRILALQSAPDVFMEFIENVMSELGVTDEDNFDPNNNADYTVANCMLNDKPGFTKSDGYNIELRLLGDGSQMLTFTGHGFYRPLILNSSSLKILLDSDTSLIASTPAIGKDMSRLLTEVGMFAAEMVNAESGELEANAKINEEFVLTNADGSPDYEIIDIGNGKGRNVMKYDIDKIERKVTPFINAEVAGLLDSEQEAVAAWNVYISKGTTPEENDQMVQDANAFGSSWSYEEDLPLEQSKKVLFMQKYKEYFMKNYLKQFMTNQIPSVQADAVVFDMAEMKKAKAQKFMDDNKLN
tara:strand:+ start:236 stop:1339 length:1104 start_codon:yes stop_codon:yes gene_type:complete